MLQFLKLVCLFGMAQLALCGTGLAQIASEPSPLEAQIASLAEKPVAEDPEVDVKLLSGLRAQAGQFPKLSPLAEATLDRLLGEALTEAGRPKDARVALVRAIERLTQAKLDQVPEAARALVALAAVDSIEGEFAAGLQRLAKAEALLVSVYGPDNPHLLHLEETKARILGRSNAFADSLALYRKAAAHRVVLPRDAANRLSSMVGVAQQLSVVGDEDGTIEQYQVARIEAVKVLPPAHIGQGMILSELATHLANVYRLSEAEKAGRDAVDFFYRNFGEASFDTAAALSNFGFILSKSGKLDEARTVLSRALAILDDPAVPLKQPSIKANTYRLRGYANFDSGKFAEAEADFGAALNVYPPGRAPGLVLAHAYTGLAKVQLSQGRHAAALANIDQSLLRLRQSMAPYVLWRVDAEMIRSLLLSRLGRNDEAWSSAKPIAEAMESRLFDPRVTQRSRASMLRIYRSNFARYAGIAAATGHPEEALRAAQLASLSEISLSSQLLATRLAALDSKTAITAQELERLQDQLTRLERSRNLASGGDQAALARLDADIHQSSAAFDSALAELRRNFPAYEALARPRPAGLAELRAGLGKAEALLFPVVADNSVVVVTVTRKGLTIASHPMAHGEAEAAIGSLRQAMEPGSDHPFDTRLAWKLGQAVFSGTTLKALKGIRRIDIVGSGNLMNLPFSVLLTAPPRPGSLRKQPFAIRRFAFSVRPLAKMAATGNGGQGQNFLGIGAPVLGPVAADQAGATGSVAEIFRNGMGNSDELRRLPSLPKSEIELTKIAHELATPGVQLLTGGRATEAALRSEPLGSFGVIAFATHGLTGGDIESLTEPALVLTPPDGQARSGSDDGLLLASEVATLALDHVDWVILSACNTGAAGERGAGGYSGLARGFTQAGARSLLVSLWPLRDDIAPRLTVATVHLHARGLDRAEALRRAQIALIEDRRVPDGANPVLWAPFVLIGR